MSLATLFLLSFDSLIVSLALGPLLHRLSARLGLALAFGVCDALAVVIGSVFGWRLSEGWSGQVGTMLVLFYGLYVLALAAWSRPVAKRWPIWLLPLFMSLDNLAFGATRTVSLEFALLSGIVSGSMALLGLMPGSQASRWFRCSAEWLAGVDLLLAGCILLFM